MNRIIFLIFLTCFFHVSLPAGALDMTPALLFTQMEENTDKIDSLRAEMILISGNILTRVSLAIQSPDKFAMEFVDKSLRVIFDGEKLQVYLESLNEVMTYDAAGSGGWVSDALRDWINPKKIITQVTRQTLFTLFNVEMLSTTPETTFPGSGTMYLADGYRMRFTPLASTVMKNLFDIGFYEIVFSKEHFLPNRVEEYAPDGKLRGMLYVLGYRINENLPKEMFTFNPPPGTKEVPLIDVIKDRLYHGKDLVIEKIDNFWESFKEKLGNWGM